MGSKKIPNQVPKNKTRVKHKGYRLCKTCRTHLPPTKFEANKRECCTCSGKKDKNRFNRVVVVN